MNGQGAECQVTLPEQQHTQLCYKAQITDSTEKHRCKSEIVPLAEMRFH